MIKYNKLVCKNVETVTTVSIMLYFLFYIANKYLFSENFIGLFLSFGIFVFLVLYLSYHDCFKVTLEEVLFYTLFLFFSFGSCLYNSNIGWLTGWGSLPGFGFAIILAKIRPCSCYVKWFTLVAMIVMLLPLLGCLRQNSSWNNISIHCLSLISLCVISQPRNANPIPLMLLETLGLVLTFASGCRSGSVCFIFLYIGSLIFLRFSRKQLVSFVLLQVIGFLLCCILFSNTFFFLFSILEKKITDPYRMQQTVRKNMIVDYLDESTKNSLNFIWGAPLRDATAIADYQRFSHTTYNPHNTYIFAYSHFGILFVLMMAFFSLCSLFYYMRKEPLWGVLLICLLLRSVTDVTAFIGIFDTFFYFFILELPWLRKRSWRIRLEE